MQRPFTPLSWPVLVAVHFWLFLPQHVQTMIESPFRPRPPAASRQRVPVGTRPELRQVKGWLATAVHVASTMAVPGRVLPPATCMHLPGLRRLASAVGWRDCSAVARLLDGETAGSILGPVVGTPSE